MKANPGGQIAVDDIVGQDQLAASVLDVLRKQGVIATAERRIGKTCLTTKIQAIADPAEFLMLYRNVENVQTALEFAEQVYAQVEKHLPVLSKGKGLLRKAVAQLAGIELGGIIKFPDTLTKHWKVLLQSAVADLVDHAPQSFVVLLWDELPLMLQKIQTAEGDATAMDLLDTLRSLRQTHKKLRMFYTGSVGLHHVTTNLRQAGHTNDATNDMRTIEVPELAKPDAISLAKSLITGENLQSTDLDATADAIADECNCIAFYIHHVIVQIKERGSIATAGIARDIVRDVLVDPQDVWHFKHFEDRLENYYGKDRMPVVLHLLDEIACSTDPVSLDHLLKTLSTSVKRESSSIAAKIMDGDKEPLRNILELLQRDHYIRRDSKDGRFVFRYPLIQRWWRIQRGVGQ